MAIKKLIIKTAIGKIANHKKFKVIKKKKKLAKKLHKKRMIKMFGKVRYRLSLWFGSWVLYTFNRKFYAPQEETEEKEALA